MNEPEWNGVKWSEFIKPQILTALTSVLSKKGVTILYGPPGVGKTTAVMLVAQKLGLRVVEVDETTLKQKETRDRLLKEVGMKSFVTKLYLYDSGGTYLPWGFLKAVIERTVHPFIIIFPERPQLPKEIEKSINIVEFPKLKRREIVEYVSKKFGKPVPPSAVSSNLREVINAVKFSTSVSEEEDIFTTLDKVFSGQRVKVWDNILWVWIIEHIDDFFSGRNLFNAVRFTSNMNLFDFPEGLVSLKGFKPKNPMHVRYRYPYLFRRMKEV